MTYLILKSLHIVAMVAWFAGLFYLPRLFVYHAESDSTAVIDQLRIMESRLYRAIMNPAIAAVYLLGFALLVLNPYLIMQTWLQIKLALVVALTAYHVSLGRMLRAMLATPPSRSSKFFRIYNEVPTIALILIVFLAILKPF